MIDVVTNNLTSDSTNSKVDESAVERCVQLLEHAGECRVQGVCIDGLRCYRACLVLLHHRACSTDYCSVCRQLKPLCLKHARHCQKKDKCCSMPFCPNGKELLHIVQSSVSLIRNRIPEVLASEPCVSEYLDRPTFTRVRSGDLLKCRSIVDKKRVAGTSRFPRNNDSYPSITSLPFHHHLGLKRHLPHKTLSCRNSSGKVLALKKETMPEFVLSCEVKVSIVPTEVAEGNSS